MISNPIIGATTKFLHGSRNPEAILQNGFKMDYERKTDAGDFGWGIYLTKSRFTAANYGKLLEVWVDMEDLAYIANPYFLDNTGATMPVTLLEKMFYELAFRDDDMLTVRGDRETRARVCKEIQEEFLAEGYKGITTNTHGDETVIFDLTAIKRIQLFNKS